MGGFSPKSHKWNRTKPELKPGHLTGGLAYGSTDRVDGCPCHFTPGRQPAGVLDIVAKGPGGLPAFENPR